MKLERKVRLCSAAAVPDRRHRPDRLRRLQVHCFFRSRFFCGCFHPAATNNSCGEGVTWALADGTLTISGTGRMTNFTKDARLPGLIRPTRSPPLRWRAPLPAWALPPSRAAPT